MTLADNLFLHFQRLPGTDVVGLGLGLATVDRIVTRRFGRVWAGSKQAEDTTFYFNLDKPATGAVIEAEVTSMDERTEYVEKLSAQMVKWDVKIDLLKDKAENATPPEKFEYAKLIAALQLKRDQAAIELQGISVASDDQWEDLKVGIERIWHEAQKILHDAIAKTR